MILKRYKFCKKNPINGLNKIVAFSFVKLSTTTQVCASAIVEQYSIEDNLEHHISSKKTIDNDGFESIVKGVANILSTLQKNGIYCCSINPSNILIQDGKFLMLREFANAYPNFYQEEQYLASELIECHEAARFIRGIQNDIYALGITMMYVYTQKSIWHDHKEIKNYNSTRFENTTYTYLLSRVKTSRRLQIFFEGTLNDDPAQRWGASELRQWLDGKFPTVSANRKRSKRNILEFNDQEYSNAKSIAYAFFCNWSTAINFTESDHVLKWALNERFNKNSLEIIKSIGNKSNEYSVSSRRLAGQIKFSRLLSAIDNNGSIRQEGLAFTIDSISYFLHYLIVNNKRTDAEKVLIALENKLRKAYDSNKHASGHLDIDHYSLLVDTAMKTKLNGVVVFGIERLIYTLNSYAPCNSELLDKEYITNIPELLTALDKIAKNSPEKFFMDRNIIAFIAAKLNLEEDIKIPILRDFSNFSESPAIENLVVLSLLQKHEPNIKIPNICKVIISQLNSLFADYLYNMQFRNNIFSELNSLEKEGDLSRIIDLLSDQRRFVEDYKGYLEASTTAHVLRQKIQFLNNQSNRFCDTLIVGQKMTVLFSYILCLIVAIMVIT